MIEYSCLAFSEVFFFVLKLQISSKMWKTSLSVFSSLSFSSSWLFSVLYNVAQMSNPDTHVVVNNFRAEHVAKFGRAVCFLGSLPFCGWKALYDRPAFLCPAASTRCAGTTTPQLLL